MSSRQQFIYTANCKAERSEELGFLQDICCGGLYFSAAFKMLSGEDKWHPSIQHVAGFWRTCGCETQFTYGFIFSIELLKHTYNKIRVSKIFCGYFYDDIDL